MRHRPELDGLRGIAVLVVLASHSRLGGFAVEGGLAGVTLFFVLSGFLITSLLAAEFNRGRGVSLRAFYIRRGLRLLPAMGALLVVVTIGYVLSAWPSPPAPQMDLPASLLVVAAYVPNWAQTVIPMGVLGHTWSLGVEEQFYLAWPVILIAGLRFLGPRRLAVAALFVAVLVMPWRYVLMEGGNRVHLFLGTDMHADALLLGCALALLSIRVSPIVGWLGIAGVIATGAWWASGGMGQLLFLPLATIASVAALAGCPAVLGWRPLAYVGRISYGLYLWHFLFIWWGWPAPLAIVVSIAVAVVSYERFERPFLRFKDRYARASVDEDQPPDVALLSPLGEPEASLLSSCTSESGSDSQSPA